MRLYLLSGLFLFLITCRPHHQQVAKINDILINNADLEYQLNVDRAYGFQDVKPHQALIELINFSIEKASAVLLKVVITNDELNDYKEYVTKNTRDAVLLEKVKKVYGSDTGAYQRWFLEPKLINIKLRSTYYQDQKLHALSKDTIQRSFNLTHLKMDFKMIAKTTGAQYSQVVLFPPGEKPNLYKLKKDSNGAPLYDSPLYKVAAGLKTGEVFSQVIEQETSFLILKKKGVTSKTEALIVETVSVEKKPFDLWQNEKAKQFKIEVYDPQLRDDIKRNYPSLNF